MIQEYERANGVLRLSFENRGFLKAGVYPDRPDDKVYCVCTLCWKDRDLEDEVLGFDEGVRARRIVHTCSDGSRQVTVIRVVP